MGLGPEMMKTDSVHELTAGDRTNVGALLSAIETETGDMGAWFTQARTSEELVWATWDGQSEDGRKWGKNYGREVFPWEGCSDQRVRLADAAVDELAQLQMTALTGAQILATAQEASDVDAAGRVQTLMNYELKQRLRPELWREGNYAVQWAGIFGHSLIHTGWETPWTTGREVLTEEGLAELLAAVSGFRFPVSGSDGVPGSGDEALAVAVLEESALDVAEGLLESDRSGELMAVLRERYPTLSERRLKGILRDLRRQGEAEFRLPVKLPGKPCVRALTPGVDVVYPAWVDCMKDAPWVAMVCRAGEAELRAKVQTEGWSPDFVEGMIKHGPGRVLDLGALVKNLSAQVNRVFNRGARETWRTKVETNPTAYEYFHIFLQTVDEDGFPATQEVVLHPEVSKEGGPVGLDRLLDYWMPGSCFTEIRREFKTSGLWETRGVPEVIESEQWVRKGITDSLMDRTALLTRPPLKVNPRRLVSNKGRADVRPGGKVPNSPGDDTDWMKPPQMDDLPLAMDRQIERRAANLLGLADAELPSPKVQMHQQWIVTNFLTQMREVALKILALDQQFMDPLQVSRVIGAGPLPYRITREEIQGQYDVALAFDVRTMDADYVKKRWDAIEKAFSLDRSGILNDVATTRWILASIDPNLADIAVPDVQAATQEEIEQEKAAVAMMAAGVEPAMKEDGQNFGLRLQVLDETIQKNEELMALYGTGGNFKAMVDARRQHLEFQVQQRENAVIGRVGAEEALANDE